MAPKIWLIEAVEGSVTERRRRHPLERRPRRGERRACAVKMAPNKEREQAETQNARSRTRRALGARECYLPIQK